MSASQLNHPLRSPAAESDATLSATVFSQTEMLAAAAGGAVAAAMAASTGGASDLRFHHLHGRNARLNYCDAMLLFI